MREGLTAAGIAGALLLGAALRLGVVLTPGLPPAGLFEDAAIALHLRAGHGFTMNPEIGPTAIKAPAYPLLLSLVARADDRRAFLRGAGILGTLFALLGIAAVGLAARALAGPAAGVLAASTLALFPAHVWLARVPESTGLSMALGSLAVLALLRARDRDAAGRWALAGALIGLAAHSNPLLLPPLLLGTALLGGVARRRLSPCALAMLLVALPWTLRNAAVFGRLVPVKSPLWMNIYLGLVPDALEGRDPLPAELKARIESRSRGLGDYDREAAIRAELAPWMKRNPGVLLRLGVWRSGRILGLWGGRPAPAPLLGSIGRLSAAALLLAALAGAWRLGRTQPAATAVLLAVIGFELLVYAFTSGCNSRYGLEFAWAEAILAGGLLGAVRPA